MRWYYLCCRNSHTVITTLHAIYFHYIMTHWRKTGNSVTQQNYGSLTLLRLQHEFSCSVISVTLVTPLPMHWKYHSLTLSHHYPGVTCTWWSYNAYTAVISLMHLINNVCKDTFKPGNGKMTKITLCLRHQRHLAVKKPAVCNSHLRSNFFCWLIKSWKCMGAYSALCVLMPCS